MLQAVQQWYSELRSSRPRKGEGGRDLNRQLQYSMRNVTAAATGCWGSLWGLQERLPEKLMLTQSLKKQIRVSRAKTAEGNHVQLLWDRENLGHLGSGTFTLVGRSEHGMGVKWQEMRLKEESWQRQKSRASWWIPRFFQPLSPFSFFKNPWKNEILEIEQTWVSTNPIYFIHKKATTQGSQSRMRASMLRWRDWNSSHMYIFHQLFQYHRSMGRGLWTSQKTSVASMRPSRPGCVILSKILVLALIFTSTG